MDRAAAVLPTHPASPWPATSTPTRTRIGSMLGLAVRCSAAGPRWCARGRTSRWSVRVARAWAGRRAIVEASGFPAPPLHGDARRGVDRPPRAPRSERVAAPRASIVDRPPRHEPGVRHDHRHRPARVVDGRAGVPADPADGRCRCPRRRPLPVRGLITDTGRFQYGAATPGDAPRGGGATRARVRPRRARPGAVRGRVVRLPAGARAGARPRPAGAGRGAGAGVDVPHAGGPGAGRRDDGRDRRPDRRGPHGA